VPYIEQLQFCFGAAGVSVFSDGKGFSGYIKKWEDMGNVVGTGSWARAAIGSSPCSGYIRQYLVAARPKVI
jgi:hypothetical protein